MPPSCAVQLNSGSLERRCGCCATAAAGAQPGSLVCFSLPLLLPIRSSNSQLSVSRAADGPLPFRSEMQLFRKGRTQHVCDHPALTKDTACCLPRPQLGGPPPPPELSPPPPASPTRHLVHPSALPPWQRVRRALEPDPLAYVTALLEAAPLRAPTARPSALLPLLRHGQHAPATLCTPRLALCGTRLADLPLDRSGKLAPLGLVGSVGSGSGSGSDGGGAVAHCHVSLGRTVKGIPDSGAWAEHRSSSSSSSSHRLPRFFSSVRPTLQPTQKAQLLAPANMHTRSCFPCGRYHRASALGARGPSLPVRRRPLPWRGAGAAATAGQGRGSWH